MAAITGKDYLIENDPRFMQIIEASRESHRREGGIPIEKIVKELGIEQEVQEYVRKRKPGRKSK